MIVFKKLSCLLMCLVLIFSIQGVAFAAGENLQTSGLADTLITVQWTNTSSVNVNLSFNNGKGTLGGYVIGKSGATKITGKAVLERQNANGTYTTIKTWSTLSSSSNILTFDATYYVTSGYTYRLTITATVYRNGASETITGSYKANA